MRLTKFSVLLLALSMLLVSCGGEGDGTDTTKTADIPIHFAYIIQPAETKYTSVLVVPET